MEILIKEMIADPDFKIIVGKWITEIQWKRLGRPEPKPGYEYKRDWYDRMKEAKMFNIDFFMENIESVVSKKSSLSSEIRRIVEYVANVSAKEYFNLKLSETTKEEISA